MSRAAIRMTMGLLLVAAIGLMLAPVLWRAGAQPRIREAFQPGRTSPTNTFPNFTSTTSFTTVAPAPPSTSSAVVTPSTRSLTTRPRVAGTTTTPSTAPTTTTPPTTLAPIPGPAPAPVTLPLAAAPQSGNISAAFPMMSGFGFLLLVALLSVQWILTKPGRGGPTL